MHFLQIALPRFRITELGSKSAIQLNNNNHNFYKCQKDYVPVFHKLMMVNYYVSFLLSSSIYEFLKGITWLDLHENEADEE